MSQLSNEPIMCWKLKKYTLGAAFSDGADAAGASDLTLASFLASFTGPEGPVDTG